jgi:hypothetical protein
MRRTRASSAPLHFGAAATFLLLQACAGGAGGPGIPPLDADPSAEPSPDAAPNDRPGSRPDAPDDGGPPPPPPPEPGAPVILSFGANVQELTVGESVTLVAVVSMPGGLQNLVGGELTSPDGRTRFGGFVATTQGTYTLQLAWADIHQATKFEFVKESTLRTRATFFGNDGKRTSRDFDLRLHCDKIASAHRGTCDGACLLLDTPQRCGTCKSSCAGECRVDGGVATCTRKVESANKVESCNDVCATAEAGTCQAAEFQYKASVLADLRRRPLPCGETVTVTGSTIIDEWDTDCMCAEKLYSYLRSGQTCVQHCESAPCRGRIGYGTVDGKRTAVAVASVCSMANPPTKIRANYRFSSFSLTCTCNGRPKTAP